MQPARLKRAKTPEEALAALMRLCARAEKSSGDALRLMHGWGVEEQAQQTVLAKLIAQRFIDDTRYAETFVREKLRLSGWGEYKIRSALRHKGIDRATIDRALRQTDRADMALRLRTQLARKAETVKYTTSHELRTKLVRYGLSLGYDFETVADAVAEQVKQADECNDIF